MKALSLFGRILLLMGLLITLSSVRSEAAQYFAPRYNFAPTGNLATPLSVEFKKLGKKHLEVKLAPLSNTSKILMIACSLGEDVFMTALNDGFEYAIYKVKFRPHAAEDVLILSYGPRGVGKTQLKGVTVIGEEAETVQQLPVQGFMETTVFNSPLQIRNQEAVLFREKGVDLLSISYDKGAEAYVVK